MLDLILRSLRSIAGSTAHALCLLLVAQTHAALAMCATANSFGRVQLRKSDRCFFIDATGRDLIGVAKTGRDPSNAFVCSIVLQ